MAGEVRFDRFMDPYADRQGRFNNRLAAPLFKDEQSLLQWNGDPFAAQAGGGSYEFPGTLYLLPYWISAYHDLLPSE